MRYYRYSIEQVFVVDGIVQAEDQDEAYEEAFQDVHNRLGELADQYMIELGEYDVPDE